jgi:hypothetical protein
LLKQIEIERLAVIAATAIEAAAVRKALPRARVLETGIALAKLPPGALEGVEFVISCGLAGGLRAAYSSGTVLIPKLVRRPDGTTATCDAALVAALTGSAKCLGHSPVDDPMLTSDRLVRGAERRVWAERGYAGVDMETGLLEVPAVAAVRVILDTPLRELSADWLLPRRALRNPRNWPEALWLAGAAPRYARRAAEIVAGACS